MPAGPSPRCCLRRCWIRGRPDPSPVARKPAPRFSSGAPILVGGHRPSSIPRQAGRASALESRGRARRGRTAPARASGRRARGRRPLSDRGRRKALACASRFHFLFDPRISLRLCPRPAAVFGAGGFRCPGRVPLHSLRHYGRPELPAGSADGRPRHARAG